jgi:AcrR family transcriptional regulator
MRVLPAPTRRRGSAAESREMVLEAAMVEFARAGYRGASTEAIAARAGVSQPYVFRLFGSKLALFLAAAEAAFERVMATFREAAGQALPTGTDPFEAMGMSYLPLLEDRVILNLQLQAFIAATDEPEIRDTCRRCFGELVEFLEALPGATAEGVGRFVSAGMFLNVAAAIDLDGHAKDAPWARRTMDSVLLDCLPPHGDSPGAG